MQHVLALIKHSNNLMGAILFNINHPNLICWLSMYFDKMSGKILSIDKTFKILCRHFMSMEYG